MAGRLLIIRNPNSPLLDYLDLDRDDQEIILIQNAVYSEKLRGKNARLLESDARGRKIDAGGKSVDYDGMLESILSAERVLCI